MTSDNSVLQSSLPESVFLTHTLHPLSIPSCHRRRMSSWPTPCRGLIYLHISHRHLFGTEWIKNGQCNHSSRIKSSSGCSWFFSSCLLWGWVTLLFVWPGAVDVLSHLHQVELAEKKLFYLLNDVCHHPKTEATYELVPHSFAINYPSIRPSTRLSIHSLTQQSAIRPPNRSSSSATYCISPTHHCIVLLRHQTTAIFVPTAFALRYNVVVIPGPSLLPPHTSKHRRRHGAATGSHPT